MLLHTWVCEIGYSPNHCHTGHNVLLDSVGGTENFHTTQGKQQCLIKPLLFLHPLICWRGELTDSFISQFFLKVAAEKSTTFHMSKNIWAAQTDLGGKKKAPSWVGREIGRWILEELWEGG